jgi:hypothetical protein
MTADSTSGGRGMMTGRNAGKMMMRGAGADSLNCRMNR